MTIAVSGQKFRAEIADTKQFEEETKDDKKKIERYLDASFTNNSNEIECNELHVDSTHYNLLTTPSWGSWCSGRLYDALVQASTS